MPLEECPSCAMEVDTSLDECPVCGYEFPHQPKAVKIMTWVMIILLLLWLLL